MSNRMQGEVRRTLRVPDDVNRWLEDQAMRNGASLNSEVVRCIRERMDRMAAPHGAGSGNDDEEQGLGNQPRRRPQLSTAS